jgi:hypothetical protein
VHLLWHNDHCLPASNVSGDEHVIPLALGGNLILREAACRKCEKVINEEVEPPVLLKEWGYLRIKHNFPTLGKSKKKRPTHVTLRSRDGAALSIPIQDCSTLVPAYKFIAPRILSGAPRTDDNKHWTMDAYGTDHESELRMRAEYPQWDGVHLLVPQPYTFARLLAKIAYCRAVAGTGSMGSRPWLWM